MLQQSVIQTEQRRASWDASSILYHRDIRSTEYKYTNIQLSISCCIPSQGPFFPSTRTPSTLNTLELAGEGLGCADSAVSASPHRLLRGPHGTPHTVRVRPHRAGMSSSLLVGGIRWTSTLPLLVGVDGTQVLAIEGMRMLLSNSQWHFGDEQRGLGDAEGPGKPVLCRAVAVLCSHWASAPPLPVTASTQPRPRRKRMHGRHPAQPADRPALPCTTQYLGRRTEVPKTCTSTGRAACCLLPACRRAAGLGLRIGERPKCLSTSVRCVGGGSLDLWPRHRQVPSPASGRLRAHTDIGTDDDAKDDDDVYLRLAGDLLKGIGTC